MGKVFHNRLENDYNLLKQQFYSPGTEWSIQDKMEIVRILQRLEYKLNIPGLSNQREANDIIHTVDQHMKNIT